MPVISGTSGNDTLHGTTSDDVIDATQGGNDTIRGHEGNDTITAGDGYDEIDGGSGDDVINAGGGQVDQIWDGPGNDIVNGGSGIDYILGSAGNDAYDGMAPGQVDDDYDEVFYREALAGITVNLAAASDQVRSTGDGDAAGIGVDQLINIEGVEGGQFGDHMTGNSGDNMLDGAGGNDMIDGAGGNDSLYGGAGGDTIHGGDGNDDISDDEGNDSIDGGEGDDRFFSGSGSDTVNGGAGADEIQAAADAANDRYDGGLGWDLLSYDRAVAGIIVDLTAGSGHARSVGVDGAAGIGVDDIANVEIIFGSRFGDTLIGDFGDNHLYGSEGDDTVSGGSGMDYLVGGTGSDIFRDSAANLNGDVIADFAAGDRIVISNASLASFAYSLSGNTLTYSGGWLMLGGFSGQLQASAAAGGGVQLTVATAPLADARHDFNGDGRSDILWRIDNGRVTDWLGQTDGSFVDNISNANINVGPDWQVAGSGDFNGDSRDDVIWRNDDGRLAEWLGQANGGFAANAGANYNVATSWHVVGVGDFNGDNRDDILWRNDNGTVTDWLGRTDGRFDGNTDDANIKVGADWQVAGVGDFNGDGRDDVIWRNEDGRLIEWLGQANGGFAANAGASYNVATSWHVLGVGDFNGDNRDDILWRNDNGTVTDWLGRTDGRFDGNTDDASIKVGSDWQAGSIGDFNGDGRDDVLWRNDDGRLVGWLGQDDGGFAGNPGASYNVPTSWHIQSPDLWM